MIAVCAGIVLSLASSADTGQATPPVVREALVRVATRHLPRGTVLIESDMTVARVVARGVSSSAPLPRPVGPGWITRRVIRAGEVLQPPAVRPAPLISAGQTVQFVVATDDLALTVSGIALSDADVGEALFVRLDGRRRMRGVAAGPARVIAHPRTTS